MEIMNKSLLLLVIAVIILTLLISIVFLIKLILKNKNSDKPYTKNVTKDPVKDIDIKDLIKNISDKNISKNEIFSMVQYFLKRLKIPPKIKGSMPNEAKDYFYFISLVSNHKNSDAKIISYFNNELKKANPNYHQEIDSYEQKGIDFRKL